MERITAPLKKVERPLNSAERILMSSHKTVLAFFTCITFCLAISE